MGWLWDYFEIGKNDHRGTLPYRSTYLANMKWLAQFHRATNKVTKYRYISTYMLHTNTTYA